MPIGELSRRVGVSTDLLRKWERRYGVLTPGRTIGNRRLYSRVDEARVRLMLTHVRSGVSAAQAAELAAAARFAVVADDPPKSAPPEVTDARGRLMSALARYDETGADRVLEKLLSTMGVHRIVRDILLPVMHEIGERWADAHMTVAQEHFATGFVHGRLLGLARGWDRGLGPRALLACAPGEQHVMGLIAFGIALHHVGWRITYLGADTPIPVLADAAAGVSPRMVVVAAAMPGRLQPLVAELRDRAGRWPVSIGGRGATAGLAREAGTGHLATDPVTAAGRALV